MKHSKVNHVLILFLVVLLFVACRKDKVQEPVIEEPTKWELISGDYKVYDTLGDYLFDMDIEHFQKEDTVSDDIRDYFRFINFDGQFTFEAKQLPLNVTISGSKNYLRIGSHDTLYGQNANRWKIISGIYEEFNKFNNDTIIFRYTKTNINYYLQDLVPYYECNCKQIAVKQH